MEAAGGAVRKRHVILSFASVKFGKLTEVEWRRVSRISNDDF